MENEIVKNKGGRPPVQITNDRVIQIMQMYYRGGCYLGAIMEKLGVSRTSASSLRKKAFKTIQESKGNDEGLYKDKYILNCRLENLMGQVSNTIVRYDTVSSPLSINPELDLIKLKHQNLLLSILKFMAELNGQIGNHPRNQVNILSLEQKVLMNILGLGENKVNSKNYLSTLLKLAEGKNGAAGKAPQAPLREGESQNLLSTKIS